MANRYWIAAGAASWNSTANWSTTSGGAGGASVPGSSDVAIFDGNGLGNCTLDIAPTVNTVQVKTAYSGTFSTAGNNLTLTSSLDIWGSPSTPATCTFQSHDSTVTIGWASYVGYGCQFEAGTSTYTLTGSYNVFNANPDHPYYILQCAAAGKTTTLSQQDTYVRRLELGTGTFTSSSPSFTVTCGQGAAGEKILTNAGATISDSGGAWPTFVLTGDQGCTFDGRSYGSSEFTVSTVDLAQETAAMTCAKLTLASTTGPVTYSTGNNNLTVNGTLALGAGDNEATLNAGSSTVTISNGTSTAVSLVNVWSLINLESSTWTVTGVWDNSVGGNVKGGTSSVTITSASAVDVKPGGTRKAHFNNLTLSGAGAKTVTQNMWVDGDWTISCAVTVSAGKGVTFNPGSTTTIPQGKSLTMSGTAAGVAAYLSGGKEIVVGSAVELGSGTFTMTNGIIERFTTTGVNAAKATVTLTHCTLYANATGVNKGATGTTTVKNSIIWGRPGQTSISGSPTVTYSDVKGGYSGTGNIDTLPRFLDYGSAGLHLAVNSPCIDAGDPAARNMGAYGNTSAEQATEDNSLRAIVNYDEQGNVLASEYGDQTLSLSTYDALSRLTALENGLGETTYFDYDAVGNQTLQLDPQEQPTYFEYDAVNRLTSTKAADGGVTSFGYDKVSNRSRATDPLANTTYYNYDPLYRVDEIIDPLEVAATYQYDGVGNLIRDTDRVAQVTYFNYDALYRNIKLAYEAGGEADYTYDSVGNMTVSDDMWGTAYFDYDPVNRVTRRQTPEEKVVDWEYQPDSVVDGITYPKAVGTAYYAYDGRRRITHVISPSEGNTYFEYTNLDQVSSRVFDNGTHSYFEYDLAQRVSEIATSGPTDNALVYFEYGRDTNGDIISMRREDGQTSYYEYDDVRRLTKETIVNSAMAVMYGYEYDFDSAGNRTYLKVTAGSSAEIYYEYDAANAITRRHTLTSAAGRTAGWAYYEYNGNGSLTSYKNETGAETSYVWDDNQLCQAIVPPTGQPTYFYYDGRLTRYAMGKFGTAGTTYFAWDGINILQTETLNGPRTHRTTLTHGATPIAGIGSVVEQKRTGFQPATRYLHNDHRGTTYKITDDAGSEVWSGLTDAYGVELGETGTPDQSIFWYQGQAWYRHEIGADVVYVSPTRIYVPEDGRFVERDLIPRVGADRYGAYQGSPTRWVDPDGRDKFGNDEFPGMNPSDPFGGGDDFGLMEGANSLFPGGIPDEFKTKPETDPDFEAAVGNPPPDSGGPGWSGLDLSDPLIGEWESDPLAPVIPGIPDDYFRTPDGWDDNWRNPYGRRPRKTACPGVGLMRIGSDLIDIIASGLDWQAGEMTTGELVVAGGMPILSGGMIVALRKAGWLDWVLNPPKSPNTKPQPPKRQPGDPTRFVRKGKKLTKNTPDGNYVYVIDTSGQAYILPNGPHQHPKVLGGGAPAIGAGEVTISGGKVVSIDNQSGTFTFPASSEGTVVDAFKKAGFVIPDGAKNFVDHAPNVPWWVVNMPWKPDGK